MHTKPARDLALTDRVIVGSAFELPSRQMVPPLRTGSHVLLYLDGLDYPVAVHPGERITVADPGDFDESEDETDVAC